MLALSIHPKYMIRCVRPGNIAVFAQLYIPFGAHDNGPAISPCTEPFRGEPVHAEILGRPIVAYQGRIAEILQLRVSRIIVVGNLAVQHFSIPAVPIVEELLNLVAADIAEYAAVLFALEEPFRTAGCI
ncbi:hypothetical protein D3C73_1017570 [compost metagenome]